MSPLAALLNASLWVVVRDFTLRPAVVVPVKDISVAVTEPVKAVFSSLSGNWSCIATRIICVPAHQERPVPPVAGSAVCERLRVRPVIVEPDTQVNEIHS